VADIVIPPVSLSELNQLRAALEDRVERLYLHDPKSAAEPLAACRALYVKASLAFYKTELDDPAAAYQAEQARLALGAPMAPGELQETWGK
jgi:hypothetical protein